MLILACCFTHPNIQSFQYLSIFVSYPTGELSSASRFCSTTLCFRTVPVSTLTTNFSYQRGTLPARLFCLWDLHIVIFYTFGKAIISPSPKYALLLSISHLHSYFGHSWCPKLERNVLLQPFPICSLDWNLCEFSFKAGLCLILRHSDKCLTRCYISWEGRWWIVFLLTGSIHGFPRVKQPVPDAPSKWSF